MTETNTTVHGYTESGHAIVRSPKGWYVVHKHTKEQYPVLVITAACLAAEARAFLELPGGRAFDLAVKGALQNLPKRNRIIEMYVQKHGEKAR